MSSKSVFSVLTLMLSLAAPLSLAAEEKPASTIDPATLGEASPESACACAQWTKTRGGPEHNPKLVCVRWSCGGGGSGGNNPR
jgi:hypothetical protein